MILPIVAAAVVDPGLGGLVDKVFSQCGIVAFTFASLATWFAWLYMKSEAGRDADRADAAKRIDAANATALKVTEASNQADSSVAVSLARVETVLAIIQARGPRD